MIKKEKIIYYFSIGCILCGMLGIIAIFAKQTNYDQTNIEEIETISFAIYGDEETQKIVAQTAEEFSKHNNCKVDIYCYSTEEELQSKIIGQAAGGNPFDVFLINTDTLQLLQNKEELLDLDGVMEKRQQEGDSFYTVALQNGNINGVQYAVPTGVIPYMIYYNLNLIEQSGYDIPEKYFEQKRWTFSDFGEYASSMAGTLQSPVIGFPESVSENVIDIMTSLKENGAISDNESYDTVVSNFVKGELPMIVGNMNMTRLCNNVSFQWDIVPVPSDNSNYDNCVLDIPLIAAGNGEHEDMSKKYISYYVSALGQKKRLESGESVIPSLNMVFYTSMGDVVFPEHSNYYFMAIENGYSADTVRSNQEEKKQIKNIWDRCMEGV